MISIARTVLAASISAGVLSSLTGGCMYHHDHEHAQVDFVDAHGYHHRGYYDENHSWHGGWTDEHHQYHNDPSDWHH